MADFTFDAACALMGRTAWVELNWPDLPEPTFTCVHIVGVVMALEGVYEPLVIPNKSIYFSYIAKII